MPLAVIFQQVVHSVQTELVVRRYEREQPDEKANSAVAHLRAAVAWYASVDVTVRRVMTDNAACYKSHAFSGAAKAHCSIVLDCQPPDLGVQLFHLGFSRASLLAAWENIGHTFDGLSLPCADLVRMGSEPPR